MVANILADAVERKRGEEALDKSRTHFAGILDAASDAIISVDENQLITLFNKGAETIFEYTAHEVLGRPLDVLIPSRVVDTHRQHFLSFSQGPEIARSMGGRGEIMGRRKDGEEFPAEASVVS